MNTFYYILVTVKYYENSWQKMLYNLKYITNKTLFFPQSSN